MSVQRRFSPFPSNDTAENLAAVLAANSFNCMVVCCFSVIGDWMANMVFYFMHWSRWYFGINKKHTSHVMHKNDMAYSPFCNRKSSMRCLFSHLISIYNVDGITQHYRNMYNVQCTMLTLYVGKSNRTRILNGLQWILNLCDGTHTHMTRLL